MSDYPTLAVLGIAVGTGCFLAILVPLVVVQYWRYGRLSPTRLLGTAALSVYLCSLIAFTLFPLPTVAEACGLRTGPILRAVPFGFVATFSSPGLLAMVLGLRQTAVGDRGAAFVFWSWLWWS